MKNFSKFSPLIIYAITITVLFMHSAGASPKKATKQRSIPLTVKQVAQAVLPSVVRLTVLNNHGVPAVQGSGLVVGNDLIVTNLHVIEGGHAVTANFENGRSETVFGVVAVDFDHDLVLLRAFTHGIRSLPLDRPNNIQIGDPVIAVGSPEGYGNSISTGVVSGFRLYSGSKVIQTTAPISHGSSGGGLINMDGQVVGITSFFNTDGQNLNFAYPAHFLRQLISHQMTQTLTWKEMEDYRLQHSITPSPIQTVPSPVNPSSSAADTAVYTKDPLSGIKEVKVVVSDIAADAKQDGLDSDAIKTAVELRLRQSGIPVVNSLSTDGSKPSVYLDVTINTLAVNDGASYVYSLEMYMYEYVTIYRSAPEKIMADTWDTGNYGIIGKDKISVIRDTINNMSDKFANEFLAQNPVPRP